MAVVTILTHHPRTGSGAALADALRAAGINASTATTASVRRTRGHRAIINWGVSQAPTAFQQGSVSWSNTTDAVRSCANKIDTFLKLLAANVPSVEFTQHVRDDGRGRPAQHLAENWLREDGKIVVRRVLNGHSGQGIEIVRTGNPIPDAPLYTRYFRKDAEYRVHVAFGTVILIQQKRRENDREQTTDSERLVRTRANGWVFTVNDLSCDSRGYRDSLCNLALRGASAVGANHCAVDILVRHNGTNDMRIVEQNSAPALRADSTLGAYTTAFTNWINTQ